MRNVIDRQPIQPLRRRIVPENGSPYFAKLEMADEPHAGKEGTNLNREFFMSLQGFENRTTEFLSNGTVKETFPTGTLLTEFFENGDVWETFTALDGLSIRKVTKTNADGTMSEVV